MPGAGGPFLMAAHVRTVQVPEADRRELERRARDKGAPARVGERARIVLLAADAGPGQQIAQMVGCAEGTVVTWRGRYAERGLGGLADLPRSGKPSPLPEGLRDRMLQRTLTEPPTALGATHWRARSATSSGCTCIRRRRRWCSAWTKSRRSRRWSGPPRRCRCGPGIRRRRALTTSGTAPP